MSITKTPKNYDRNSIGCLKEGLTGWCMRGRLRTFSGGSVAHPEYQYLNLVKDIIDNGEKSEGRNGTTYHRLGTLMKFPLSKNTIPLLTTKKLAWRTCLKELLWFISGDTSNQTLLDQNVNIWDKNAKVSYIMKDHALNDLGPIYGHQWRHFNAKYRTSADNYGGKGIDQLQNIVEDIQNGNKETKRRLIMTAWNPEQLSEMALPPCHIMSQFHVHGDKLSCSMYQRSGDVGLGVPFNIASYAFLTHLIAHHCDLKPHYFYHHIGDAHIYDNHIDPLKEIMDLEPYEFPSFKINSKRDTIDDYKVSDFEVTNYRSHPPIKMSMVA